ncbi:putative solute-binding protein [Venatoribacter cucullus]|uniref:putative solute-binding protein n=1 Tax=Venatoribacter cucullus TaxID=2661630 RepID=UPI00223F3F18|nr:putative solute-binding protein [Venatoribacter cucullus]UZK03388.1 hypothetical protein GAY96_05520 [Venatoribacter cucullus]
MNQCLWVAMLATVLLMSAVHAAPAEDRRLARLEATVMSQTLPLQKRIEALRSLHADIIDADGKIRRLFCVWDMLGRSGPVYTTVDDQRFRSLHYGLELTLKAYQDEQALIDDLRAGRCDAGLISGIRALEFNRFSGTLEALGAIPDSTHLQLLVQVLASPRTAEHLTDDNYVVLGAAALGESYLYTHSDRLLSVNQLAGKTLGVPRHDQSLQALAANTGASVQAGELLAVVDDFVSGRTDAMLAPLIGFHVAGTGKVKAGSGIVNARLSQSTIQLIGRAERFPIGLAQMLREDFLFKFDSYVKRVETERANIQPQLWFPVAAAQQQALDSQLRELRIQLREQGVYDAHMLRLMKRVRCRINPSANECSDERE